MRCFEPYPVLPTATSRIAATGGTLPALRAGEIAATSVTPTPATSEMITVLAVRTIPPAGSSKPNAARSALSAPATRMPRPIPTTEAIRPTASASTSTDTRTCRFLAPSARSSAFSRVRCATVMKNVLKMMKPPTSRAITANTNMKVLKKLRPCSISSWLSFVISAPVTASVPVGSSGAMRWTISVCEIPSSAMTKMPSNLSGSAISRCAVSRVNSTNDAPPGESASPNFAMPAMVTSWGPPFTSTCAVSPTR